MRYHKRKSDLLQNQLQLKVNLQQKEIEKIKELERQRKRIFRDLHDNIGSSLAAAKLETDLMKRHQSELQPEILNLEKIIQDSYEGLKKVVWFMNSKNDKISNLAGYLEEYVMDFFEGSPIQAVVSADLAQDHRYISAPLRRDILSIVMELMHNVLKHSQASQVHLDMSADGGYLYTIVEDDGIGVQDEHKSYNSNGLQSIEERIIENKGKLMITSEQGFRVEFHIPLEQEA